MNMIKGLIIGIVIVIILAIITFFTFNKSFMTTNKQPSPPVSSQAAKSVAKTPVDTNNIASPTDKNSPTNTDDVVPINTDNNIPNKSITINNNSNNKTVPSHNETNTINSNSTYKNNIISSKNTNTNLKPIDNNTKSNNKPNNNNIINNTTATKNNSSSQNFQMYYLNQLTSISEKINGISTNNDNDAQLLSNAGMQCNSWNSEMNVITTKLSEVLPKSQYATLAKAQYNWMTQRNGTVQVLSDAGGSISPILAAQKEAQLTKDRCYYLVNNYMPS